MSNHYRRNPLGFSHNVRQALGLADKAKLPTEGMAPKVINGFKVWVDPLPARDPNIRRHRRMNHRVRVECPTCGEELSAGRLHQHRCKDGSCTFCQANKVPCRHIGM